MTNYISNFDINEMKRFLTEQLPNWEDTTADILLDAFSKSDNQQVKETAELIKVSKKSQEILMVLDFALSMIRKKPTPIRENIYDEGMNGIFNLRQHFIDKYGTSQEEKNSASAFNWFLWLIYRIPGKEELRRKMLIY